MGFLKDMAIKKVTTKRFNQLIGLIENDLPPGSDPPVYPMGTLSKYIRLVESSGETIEVPPGVTSWTELLIYLIWIAVRAELSYDPTMGTERDRHLVLKTAIRGLEKWKAEPVLKKFARREMIMDMGDKFVKRS